MNKLISRLQKDLAKLQTTIQKEGNDLLEKVRSIDFEDRKHDIEQVIEKKLKKLEPVYQSFVSELRRSAEKAGISIGKFEEEIKKTAAAAKQRMNKTGPRSGKAKTKTKTKTKTKAKTGAKAATKTSSKAKTKASAKPAGQSSSGVSKKTSSGVSKKTSSGVSKKKSASKKATSSRTTS